MAPNVPKNINLQYFLNILLIMFISGFVATQVSTSKTILEGLDSQTTLINNTIYFSVIGLAIIFFILKKTRSLKKLLFILTVFMTMVLVDDVRKLMTNLAAQKNAVDVLLDAFFVWVFNVLLFTVWYWSLDRNGVENRSSAERADIIFPQEDNQIKGWEDRKPGFLDYLFFSFYSCMALSPTETVVLSKKMKFLLMIQTSVSLVVLAMIAARAINLIN